MTLATRRGLKDEDRNTFMQSCLDQGAASLAHYFMVALVSTVVFGSLALGIFVVLRSWRDYLAFLRPSMNLSSSSSLKRDR
jgi:hypothetical protein